MTAVDLAPTVHIPRHLAGLDAAAQTVRTSAFRKTQALAKAAADLGEIASFTGDPGLGKTFAVDYFVNNQPREWLWLDMPPRPQPKELLVRLMRELVGNVDSKLPAYDLADDLIDVLKATPRIIVIDEAQNLDRKGLNQLRWLHDQRADWALFFVGGVGCNERLSASPELASRVGRKVRFTPLEGDELVAVLGEYHPLYANAERALLERINKTYAKDPPQNNVVEVTRR